MMSLFSSFDLNIFFSQFFLISFLGVTVLIVGGSKFSNLNFFYVKLHSFFMIFFSSLSEDNLSKNLSNFLISIMVLFFFLNFSSIFSFNFAFSTQVSLIFFMSLAFWLSLMIFSLTFNTKGSLSHFMPEGAPIFLSPFLVVIEMVSVSIRPLTLMVRLVANILAGHLLVILLSMFIQNFSLFYMFLSGLNLVESLVSLIQSYILVTLMALYYSEL